MKDRQFMTVLGLVVAAGLVMGLIAFRMTAGNAPVATAAVGAKAGAPQSSATGTEWGDSESSTPSSTDAQPSDQIEARDGASPDIATPEPAPPPPPPPPAEPVDVSSDTQS